MASEYPVGTIETEQHGDVTLLRLLGEHDMATGSDLRRAIEDSVAAGQGLVVSLIDTQFVDSHVVRLLLLGDGLLRAQSRRLVLHVTTASIVKRALDISQLSSALPCTGSLPTAITLASTSEGDPK